MYFIRPMATGSSRKGYWRLSKSLGTQTGMTPIVKSQRFNFCKRVVG